MAVRSTRAAAAAAAGCLLATFLLANVLAVPAPDPPGSRSPRVVPGGTPSKERIAARDRLFESAQRLRDQGQTKEAVSLLLQVEAIDVELGLEYDQAGVASFLAALYEQLGELEKARRQIEASRRLLERSIRRGNEIEAGWRLEEVRWQEHDFELRRSLDPQGLRRIRSIQDLLSPVGVLWDTGRYQEALARAERALRLEKSVYGREHPAVARRLLELGLLHFRTGDYYEAQRVWTEAVGIHREVFEHAHPSYAENLFNLGTVSRLMGRYDEAESLLRESHATFQVTRSIEHPDSVRPIVSLGKVQRQKGDLLLALETLQQARKLAPQTGELHREILSALAEVRYELGDLDGTNALLVELDEATRAEVGEDHVEYSDVLQSRAALSAAEGDFPRAQTYYERAESILSEAPIDPLKSIGLWANEAMLHYSVGDYRLSLRLLNQALELFDRSLPRNHPQRAELLINLAAVMDSLGQPDQVEKPLLEALAIIEDRLGNGHPLQARILSNLGVYYQRQGDLGSARELLTRAAEQVPSKSRLAVSIRIRLANLDLLTGSFDAKALQDLESALRSLADVMNPHHPDYCYALTNLAAAQVAMFKPSESKETFRSSLDCLRRILDLSAVVQSERQQLAMLVKARQVLDSFLSCLTISMSRRSIPRCSSGKASSWPGACGVPGSCRTVS